MYTMQKNTLPNLHARFTNTVPITHQGTHLTTIQSTTEQQYNTGKFRSSALPTNVHTSNVALSRESEPSVQNYDMQQANRLSPVNAQEVRDDNTGVLSEQQLKSLNNESENDDQNMFRTYH